MPNFTNPKALILDYTNRLDGSLITANERLQSAINSVGDTIDADDALAILEEAMEQLSGLVEDLRGEVPHE